MSAWRGSRLVIHPTPTRPIRPPMRPCRSLPSMPPRCRAAAMPRLGTVLRRADERIPARWARWATRCTSRPTRAHPGHRCSTSSRATPGRPDGARWRCRRRAGVADGSVARRADRRTACALREADALGCVAGVTNRERPVGAARELLPPCAAPQGTRRLLPDRAGTLAAGSGGRSRCRGDRSGAGRQHGLARQHRRLPEALARLLADVPSS